MYHIYVLIRFSVIAKVTFTRALMYRVAFPFGCILTGKKDHLQIKKNDASKKIVIVLVGSNV